MINLSHGSRGPEVMFLQCLLNKRGASPRLAEDGIFGNKTKTAVIAFQSAQRVAPANGTVGATTWAKFGALTEKLHTVTAFAQPTNMTCWSAASTIILGNMSVGPGSANLLGGGLEPSLSNVETFVNELGWRIVNTQSAPPASSLTMALNRKPLWIVFEGADFAHAVVFSGYWSDGTEDATVFRVHDPWPPNSGTGTVYGTTYHRATIFLRSVSPPKAAMIAFAAQP
jgi:peptidoglycan hydrolase-like protein with peptidoglycan-binding domain